MPCRGRSLGRLTFFCVVCALGCTGTKTTERSPVGEESSVRETFVALQAALKARNGEKLYALLDRESQADAERASKAVQAAYAKAARKEKSEQEQRLGLSGAELAELTAANFLKSKRFHGKYEEIATSTIDKVTVQGDRAVINYTEADGDREKLNLVRQAGQWKVSPAMPRAVEP